MKFLAMHINNQKLSYDIFTVGNIVDKQFSHNQIITSVGFLLLQSHLYRVKATVHPKMKMRFSCISSVSWSSAEHGKYLEECW